MKTVKEMSQISGISVRTLHYYDQIGLLTPSFIGENGYRFYDMDAFERLQEILLFRELEFPLKKIKEILSDPSYDKEEALCEQIKWLELKKEHLEKVICHAKSLQENGGNMMTFTAYDKSELEAFQREAKERWGTTEAYQAFEKNPQTDFSVITEEMAAIMRDFAKLKEFSFLIARFKNKLKLYKAILVSIFTHVIWRFCQVWGKCILRIIVSQLLSIKRQVKGQLVLSALPLQNMLKITDNL